MIRCLVSCLLPTMYISENYIYILELGIYLELDIYVRIIDTC